MLFETIRQAVLDGKPRLVEKQIKKALAEGRDSREILEMGILPALEAIENNDCEDEEQIIQTISCSRAVKKGIECIEAELGEKLFTQNETVLIGTAVGDLHDMGKDIVALYFKAAGFRVVDLGVDVSAGQFVKSLEEHPEIRIVCVSTLLKTAYGEVRHIVQAVRGSMKHRELFLMLGGGAMTEETAAACGADCYTETAVAAVGAAREYVTAGKGSAAAERV